MVVKYVIDNSKWKDIEKDMNKYEKDDPRINTKIIKSLFNLHRYSIFF